MLLGVEQAVMPLFDLSAFALSMLVFSGRRDLRAYVVSGVSSIPNNSEGRYCCVGVGVWVEPMSIYTLCVSRSDWYDI